MAMPVIIVMATMIIFVATDVYANFTKFVNKICHQLWGIPNWWQFMSLSSWWPSSYQQDAWPRYKSQWQWPNNNEHDVRFSNILMVWLRKSYVLSFCPKSLKLRTGKCDSRYFLYLLCVSSIEFGNVVTWHYFGNLFFLPLSKIFDIRCFQHAILVVPQL